VDHGVQQIATQMMGALDDPTQCLEEEMILLVHITMGISQSREA